MKILNYLILASCIFLQCERTIFQQFADNPYIDYHSIQTNDGTELKFVVVLPENYSEDKTYPVLITFPPGEQSMILVESVLEQYWITSSIQSGWIVVSPATPTDQTFYTGNEIYIPELMDWISNNYHVEGNKFHLGGVSSGGISAFQIAIENYRRVKSVIAFPGYPLGYNNLERLKSISVIMFAGEHDYMLSDMRNAYNACLKLGIQIKLKVITNNGHVIDDLSGKELIAELENVRNQG